MGRYTMGATVRDVIILLHYVPIPERSSPQKQYKQEVRRCLVGRAFLFSHPPNLCSAVTVAAVTAT